MKRRIALGVKRKHTDSTPAAPPRTPTKPPVTAGEFNNCYLLMVRDMNRNRDPFGGMSRSLKGYQHWFGKAFSSLAPDETAELAASMLKTMCA
jgi:hypothetical protein